MKTATLALLAVIASSAPLLGVGAAYLPDGKGLVSATDKLIIKNLKDFSETELKFPEGFAAQYAELATTPDGLLIVAGDRAAMSWNPATGEWLPLWSAPEGWTIDGLACEPESGNLVFVLRSAEGELVWKLLPKGGNDVLKVFNRHAAGASAPSFDLKESFTSSAMAMSGRATSKRARMRQSPTFSTAAGSGRWR